MTDVGFNKESLLHSDGEIQGAAEGVCNIESAAKKWGHQPGEIVEALKIDAMSAQLEILSQIAVQLQEIKEAIQEKKL